MGRTLQRKRRATTPRPRARDRVRPWDEARRRPTDRAEYTKAPKRATGRRPGPPCLLDIPTTRRTNATRRRISPQISFLKDRGRTTCADTYVSVPEREAICDGRSRPAGHGSGECFRKRVPRVETAPHGAPGRHQSPVAGSQLPTGHCRKVPQTAKTECQILETAARDIAKIRHEF